MVKNKVSSNGFKHVHVEPRRRRQRIHHKTKVYLNILSIIHFIARTDHISG
jgi:GrpB-like predicted nucleotidyltransferase (UPF0157 family)